MQNLIGILDSFHNKRTDKRHIKDLANIIRDLVVPTYPSLEASIEQNKARFTPGWDQVFSSLKEARIFEHFLPVRYGGKKSLGEDINRLCADARGMEYLEGTSNVQKMIMDRELFRMYHKESNSP